MLVDGHHRHFCIHRHEFESFFHRWGAYPVRVHLHLDSPLKAFATQHSLSDAQESALAPLPAPLCLHSPARAGSVKHAATYLRNGLGPAYNLLCKRRRFCRLLCQSFGPERPKLSNQPCRQGAVATKGEDITNKEP